MAKEPAVYILTNKFKGTLYVGVTSDLMARMAQHHHGHGSEFVAKYNLSRLVHVEFFPSMPEAIRREKLLKRWRREWKIKLISENNPDWLDLIEKYHH